MKARSRGRLGTMLAALGALAMVVGAGAAGAATSTPAGASAWWRTEEGSARLVAATGAVGEAEALRLGLEFRLAPGWKVYWRSAGAAGYPPRLDWSGSINLAAATPAWPAPTRFSILGLDTLGYEGAVVLPITARPAVPGRAVRLHARLDYLTCKDICIPYRTELALALPAGEAFPTPFAPLIARYQARVPGPATADGLAIEGVRVRGRDGARLLEVAVRARAPLTAPDLFVEGPPAFEFGAPTARLDPDGRGARLRLPVGVFGEAPPALAGSRLRLTLVDGDRALETAVTVAPGAPVETAGTYPLLSILGLALLGGLILNLMPCVLPVLSIKLLGAVELGGRDRAQVRRGFLASAAGILFAFGILASAAIAVKLGGGTLGWGIQFQEPLFLVAMGAVLVLFAANLWGLFEIRLPGTIADRAAGPVPAGRLAGPFFTGVLATVLATPCSAPFLGTAVGFALVRGPGEIVAVFAALGIGLAAPYLAVAAVPGAAALLPRPGPWMGTLRRLLALALVGTAVWLMTVLAAQQGLGAALVVAGLLAALGAVVWLGRELAARGRAGAAAVLVALALGVPALWPAVGTAPAGSATLWRPFAPGAIAGHVSAGRTVFVNVTADWCLTCRVNEAVALDTGPVTARLGGPEVVAMRADWTRADPAIAGYLESFGRYGIPFDAVYGPALPEGMALPELLTEALVIGGLDAARGAEGTRAVAGTGARTRLAPCRPGGLLVPRPRANVPGGGKAMTVNVGDRIPSLTLKHMTGEGPAEMTTEELCAGKKVALFAVPGAFTPTCSAKHLPGFVKAADAIRAKGVDTIACVAVNDAFVMGAWGDDQGVGEKVLMLADGSADLTRALGLELDLNPMGLGVRSRRYSMIIEDGVVTTLNLEEGGSYKVSGADTMLGQL